ncbi:MAG: amidohydrolase [Candidatus Anstonellales archaeon]
MSILIKEASVLSQGSRVQKQDVFIEGNIIEEISSSINKTSEFKINANGSLLIPGFINTHTHVAMSLLRGYSDDLALKEWLSEKIWPAEKKMDPKAVYAGSMLSIAEMLRSGTTCFSDMYFHMDSVARAVDKSGIRATLGYGMIDHQEEDKMKKELIEAERFARKWNKKAEGRITASICPHAPNTCSEKLLKEASRISKALGCKLHIHLSETRNELIDILKKTNKRPVQYLESLGFLSGNLIAAHCVWLSKQEILILAKHNVSVALCPVSNMKLAGGGAPPVPEFISSGLTISLGTDGPASNNSLSMFETMKTLVLSQKHARWDAKAVTCNQAFDFATVGGAKALGIDAGEIARGKLADLILVDTKAPNTTPNFNPISNIVYSAHPGNVTHTIVNGKLLMEDRKIIAFDENKVIEEAQRQSEKLITQS